MRNTCNDDGCQGAVAFVIFEHAGWGHKKLSVSPHEIRVIEGDGVTVPAIEQGIGLAYIQQTISISIIIGCWRTQVHR